jgi:hypothetical protein
MAEAGTAVPDPGAALPAQAAALYLLRDID